MPTKTIIIGRPSKTQPKKEIEFTKFLNSTGVVTGCVAKPHNYKYIELICKNYYEGFDLMFAYDGSKDRSAGVLYIGHWNAGIVSNV